MLFSEFFCSKSTIFFLGGEGMRGDMGVCVYVCGGWGQFLPRIPKIIVEVWNPKSSLGNMLGRPGAIFEASWVVLGRIGGVSGRNRCVLGRLGTDLKAFSAVLARLKGARRRTTVRPPVWRRGFGGPGSVERKCPEA